MKRLLKPQRQDLPVEKILTVILVLLASVVVVALEVGVFYAGHVFGDKIF